MDHSTAEPFLNSSSQASKGHLILRGVVRSVFPISLLSSIQGKPGFRSVSSFKVQIWRTHSEIPSEEGLIRNVDGAISHAGLSAENGFVSSVQRVKIDVLHR